MNRPRPGVRHAGFTLIELLTILALASILLAFSIPSLTKVLVRQKLEGLVRETSIAMQQARFQAIRTGQAGQVCASAGAKTITATVGTKTLALLYLPTTVDFAGPPPQLGIDVPGGCFVFRPDGSVDVTGSFRIADAKQNYLEIRVEPQATAKVQVRKWNDVDSKWYTRDQGGKPWDWKI